MHVKKEEECGPLISYSIQATEQTARAWVTVLDGVDVGVGDETIAAMTGDRDVI